MHIALLTAAGTGTRMHLSTPKQFIHVEGRPVIVHTMERFHNHPGIDAIMVVTLPQWSEVVWDYARQYGITKLKWVVPGGATGQESIRNGLEELRHQCDPDDTITIHDGNRCFVSAEIISNNLAVFENYGDAVTAIPCVEAVFRSKDGASSTESIPREQLWRTQTPHTYKLSKLLWAHEEAERRGITDTAASCTLMYELGETVHFSLGSEENLKLTTRDDLHLFKALLRAEREGMPW